MKTSGLTGPALDWAVAKCEGRDCYCDAEGIWFRDAGTHKDSFSTDYGGWELCGPIIDQIVGIQLGTWVESRPESKCEAHIHNLEGNWIEFGPTLLIAAMRVYVASKLGDEVEIPEELR